MNINENTKNGRKFIKLKYIHSYCWDQISRLTNIKIPIPIEEYVY